METPKVEVRTVECKVYDFADGRQMLIFRDSQGGARVLVAMGSAYITCSYDAIETSITQQMMGWFYECAVGKIIRDMVNRFLGKEEKTDG